MITKKILGLLFFLTILFNLFLASWYAFHQDIIFNTDVARDFLLFREIDQKKFILIGPRANGPGFFHGPVWAYLNYPAYLLGRGNPIIVAWNWIFFSIVFLVSGFIIAKKLFGQPTAYLYALFISLYLAFHTRCMSHPHGFFFTAPLFFFLLVRYLKTNKIKYLITHVFVGGMLIQFELAIGIPYVILSSLLIIWITFKRGNQRHLLAYFFLVLSLSNFLVFHLRHQFYFFTSIKKYLLSHFTDQISYHYPDLIKNRLSLILTGLELPRENPYHLKLIFNLVFFTFIISQIRQKIYRVEYLLFLYFYFGFFLLSFINKGMILYWYIYPQFSLAFLIFSSLITSRRKKLFMIFFLLIYLSNQKSIIKDLKYSREFIGKNTESWSFLLNLAQKVYQPSDEDNIGYFVYSPDSVGYQPKYAMFYAETLFPKKIFYFEKRPITYVVAAPHPYYKDDWWIKNQINIDIPPVTTIEYDNGYKIKKFLLDEKAIKIPFDASLDPGLHFR